MSEIMVGGDSKICDRCHHLPAQCICTGEKPGAGGNRMSDKYEYTLSDVEDSIKRDLATGIFNMNALDMVHRFEICLAQRAELAERNKELEAVVDWITSNVNDCWWDREQAGELIQLLKKAGYMNENND